MPTNGLFETVSDFAMTSIGFERDVLIWSDLNKSFDCPNQVDTESIRDCLIFSKISYPRICGQEEPILSGHSNI